jgi:hypothetical protein
MGNAEREFGRWDVTQFFSASPLEYLIKVTQKSDFSVSG